jgi:filamentous hemagglutinin family protein
MNYLSKISVTGSFLFCLSIASLPATAQVTPDGTTSTTVNTNGNNFQINDGDRAGSNLFHSFRDFSVRNGGEAFFNNANDIVNIFSRVTGGNISNIDGLLRANGSANLFLINPAGIIFGNNARLDIGGSFYGTSADSILFEDGEFSATDLDNPPLLTINAPIGLSLRDNPGDITVRGNGQGRRSNTDLIDTEDALRVDSNQTFALIGGNLNLEGATIKTAGGRIELGSVEGNTRVNLTSIAEGFSLGYEEVQNFRDIQLSQAATVDASGLVSGDIRVQGNNITLTEGSQIEASTVGTSLSQDSPGSVEINAIDTITIDGEDLSNSFRSGIFNQVYPGAVGNAGELNITTANLALTNGGQINVSTGGQGDGGSIDINATESVTLDGTNADGNVPSAIGNTVESGAVGNAGALNITTANLTLTNGGQINVSTGGQGDGGSIDINATNLSLTNAGQIQANTSGQGDGGSIDINATGSITLDGTNADGDAPSGIFNIVQSSAVGNAGALNITTANLTLTNAGQIQASTLGQGDGGSIDINATESITLDGTNADGDVPSGILNTVESGAVGNGGVIDLTANNLSLTNGGQIQTIVRGANEQLGLEAGNGIAGNIIINVDGRVSIDATNSSVPSLISSSLQPGATGQSGNININAGSLAVSNQGQLLSATFGNGNAGDITIDADEINITQTEAEPMFLTGIIADVFSPSEVQGGDVTITSNEISVEGVNSFISAEVNFGAAGNAGNLNINTTNLEISNGGIIGVSTLGDGNAGDLNINASNSINLNGNGILIRATVIDGATGNGGNVNIETNNLNLTDGAQISASTFSSGNAGALDITANNAITLDGSGSAIGAQVEPNATGQGGDVTINTGNFTLADGAFISTSTFGQGSAGVLDINANSINVDASIIRAEVNLTFTEDGEVNTIGSGNGGSVEIDTANLNLTNNGLVSVRTFGEGNAGNLRINATDTIDLNGSGILINATVQSGATGNGGGVNIETNNLNLTDGAQISASTFGEGNAGALDITANNAITLDGSGSAIGAQVEPNATGQGGDVTINTGNFTLADGAFISTSTFGQGSAGVLDINASNSINISGSAAGIAALVGGNATGKGGDVTIVTNNLNINNNGQISVSSLGNGDAGMLTIDANSISLDTRAEITASTRSGDGGNITFNDIERLELSGSSQISAGAFGDANGGNIVINAPEGFVVAFPSANTGNDIIANAERGQGGTIEINAQGVLGFDTNVATNRQNTSQGFGSRLNNGTNDLDVTSASGSNLNGTIDLNIPDVDSTQGTIETPQNPIPEQTTVAEACSANPDTEKPTGLTVKGKGGIIPPPNSPLSADVLNIGGKITAERSPSVHDSKGEENAASTQINPESAEIEPIRTSKGDIYPARGIIKTADGRVILTAYPTENIATRTPTPKPNCH